MKPQPQSSPHPHPKPHPPLHPHPHPRTHPHPHPHPHPSPNPNGADGPAGAARPAAARRGRPAVQQHLRAAGDDAAAAALRVSWLGLGTAGRALRRRSPTWVRVAEAAADCIQWWRCAPLPLRWHSLWLNPRRKTHRFGGLQAREGEQTGVSFKQGKLALVHLWCQTQRDASHRV